MKRFLLLLLCLAVTAGCGGADDRERDRLDRPNEDDEETVGTRDRDDSDDIDPTDPESIAGALGQMFGGDGKKVETVDFRSLRDLLPDEVEGMERTDIGGERTGMAGFTVSNAHAEYRDDDRSLKIQITDGGGIGQMALLGATWMQMDFDREDNDGYERTTEFEGYPALEKFQERNQRAELQFVVGERFFVSVEGRGMDMDDVHDAVDELDLDDLEDMKDEGVES